jgi:L-rhamnonate dehydratase
MKIAKITATPVHLPLSIALVGAARPASLGGCLVEIETDGGLVGHGFTSITEEEVIAHIIDRVAAPAIMGDDPLAHERIWDKLYWTMLPRGQTGYGAHALAAIDVALWDIKGKALGQPIWRLLGGARDRVPVYVTFGFHFFDREELAEAAKFWVGNGFKRLKMTVAHEGLARRDRKPLADLIREDAARVRAVRTAVGPDVELFIDANCSLDLYHALRLVDMIRDCNISFFEEPITQNDALLMAQLRKQGSIRPACGQNEGLSFRFRDLLLNEAVDYVQPNAVITGGFTQCLKIAGLAASFNVSLANGGAWAFHNMHLQAGVANGTLIEHHYLAGEFCRRIYKDLPIPTAGWLTLPQAPGLGFELDRDALKELVKASK